MSRLKEVDRAWGRHLAREVRRAQREFRQSIPAYLRDANVLSLVVSPAIYMLILPVAALDLCVTMYQRICFPVFGIAQVSRRRYFAIDRHKLAYLNWIEKVNCTYCSYANGVLAYVGEIAARTEQFWCPIKHARPIHVHSRYRRFFEYGDARRYRRELNAMRRALRPARRRL